MRFLLLASCTGVQVYREFMSQNDDLPNWIPVACTLPTDQQPARLTEFDELFRDRVIEADRSEPMSLWLTRAGSDEVAARVQDLTARETQCCSFFTFELSPAAYGLRL